MAHPLVNGLFGKAKDWPFDEHFDNLLELANHGVLHANQVSFIVATLSSPFQTKPGMNLKTQTLKSGFHFAQYCRNFHFFIDRGTTCGSSSRLGGPKGDAFSHVSRWPVQAFYLAFSQLETGDDNLSPLIEAFYRGVVESLACFRSNFVVEDPSDKDLPRELSKM